MSVNDHNLGPGQGALADDAVAAGRVRADTQLDRLGLMAGGIAHDFNNHLLAILGNADLLAQELTPETPGRELLGEIKAAAERAADLCSQLLAFAGKGHFSVSPVDANATLRGMIPMLQTAISRRISLRLDTDNDTPLIDADIPHLQQVIMNLAVNASDAIGPGDGVIQLRTGRADGSLPTGAVSVLGADGPSREYGYVEVADSGPGMSPAVLGRAFDPFFSTKNRGRGLGLASVLGIMRGHHGQLWVRSVVDEGTSVRLCFPASTLASAAAATPRRDGVARSGRRVLVVEDEELVRALCQRMLRRLGYEVIVVADGRAGLAAFDANRGRIDVVLLDLIMPDLDGVEVFNRLAALDPSVPVVMTSGYHEREISHRFAGRGVSGFLQKPYVLHDLAAALDRVLNDREPGPGREV